MNDRLEIAKHLLPNLQRSNSRVEIATEALRQADALIAIEAQTRGEVKTHTSKEVLEIANKNQHLGVSVGRVEFKEKVIHMIDAMKEEGVRSTNPESGDAGSLRPTWDVETLAEVFKRISALKPEVKP